jgi:cellulose synthase/poly-beta-1,6-N-acetylglucosamine synthase-like glycosyltransferase
VADLVRSISDEPYYLVLMVFLGLYPVVTGAFWIAGAIHFYLHREARDEDGFYHVTDWPMVSVIVPAYNE